MTSRRRFLQYALGSGTLLLVPSLIRQEAQAQAPTEPHFFLQIFLQGGADTSYLFDARPLAMTAAGKIQNYIGREPAPWLGHNGGRCLATDLTNPLVPLKDYFSILNGVMMEPTFPGHDQNSNSFFTGNAFGGESFVPHLNQDSHVSSVPLDALQAGFLFSNTTNGSSTVKITSAVSDSLESVLAPIPVLGEGDEVYEFIQGRMQTNAAGVGRFSQGSQLLAEGFAASSTLHRKFNSLPPGDTTVPEEINFVELASRYFRSGLSRSAIWSFNQDNGNLDTHAGSQAQLQPEIFKKIVSRLARILDYLRTAEFDRTRSMLDVTTVVVTSEFSRTMRQEGRPIAETGTDHNTLTNSVLLAGYGVVGGQVIGESDIANESERPSDAHVALDPLGLQLMGRPFDFATMKPRSDKPAVFENSDYLTIHSVVNSLYGLFGVPESKYRALGRGKPTAPILKGLFKT